MRIVLALLVVLAISLAQAEPNQALTVDNITQWQFTTQAPLMSSPSLYLSQVYIGDLDGNIYALAADTGNLLWQFKADAPVRTRPAAHDNGVVIAAGNTLYAFDLNGQKRWATRFENTPNDAPLDPWDIHKSSNQPC